MIIAFTGKAGSGKNTAASMVNYVLNGYTYKDWNKGFLYHAERTSKGLEDFKFKNTDIIFEEKSFAGKMKDVCPLLTGIPREDWDNRELRNKELDIEDLKNVSVLKWGYSSTNRITLANYTYRTFMQRVGTEAMRGMVHENIWVNALMKDYRAINYLQCITSEGFISPIMPDWVITDLRFDNEALAIKERGGVIIKIERPDVETIKHSSEVGIDKKYIDHTVFNHDGFEDLYDVLEWLLSDYFPNEQ